MRFLCVIGLTATAAALQHGLAGARASAGASAVQRRALLQGAGAVATSALVQPVLPALADDKMEDLPPGAVQAYKQQWPGMQLATDYYVFELLNQVANPQAWDNVGALMEGKSSGSAQSPSQLERRFITPMRILALSFPPDEGGDEMQAALDSFQKSMFKLGREARSSPGGGETPNPNTALGYWDAGRQSLNAYLVAMNTATGINRLVPIPPKGQGYPRSKARYTQFKKDAAICQNRGGEALAGVWGNLMVYGVAGTGVSPCGMTAAEYFQGM